MINDIYIKAKATAVSRSTAQLMKTGQTTSYRTGDDGDIEAGRLTSFTTLAENNPFGNTNRFTDELGGTTYTKNIVIDWSTYNGTNVLGYYRIATVVADWNAAIDAAAESATLTCEDFGDMETIINTKSITDLKFK